MSVFKKYWFLVLLAFVATSLVIINLFLPKKETGPATPTVNQESIWKGIIPGQTSQEQLINVLGAPDPKLSDFSTNTLAYPRQEGARPNEVIVEQETVSLIKEKVVVGIYSDIKQKHGPSVADFYGPEQDAGFKLYVYNQKGFAVLASEGDGAILEIWHFQPTTIDKFLENSWAINLSTKPKEKKEGY